MLDSPTIPEHRIIYASVLLGAAQRLLAAAEVLVAMEKWLDKKETPDERN